MPLASVRHPQNTAGLAGHRRTRLRLVSLLCLTFLMTFPAAGQDILLQNQIETLRRRLIDVESRLRTLEGTLKAQRSAPKPEKPANIARRTEPSLKTTDAQVSGCLYLRQRCDARKSYSQEVVEKCHKLMSPSNVNTASESVTCAIISIDESYCVWAQKCEAEISSRNAVSDPN